MSGSIVAAATALRQVLSGFDAGLFSGADCARIAEELAATEKACAGARNLAAVRAGDCKAHVDLGFNDPAQWLASRAGISTSEAKRSLRTAGKLDDHPDTKRALLDGRVSLDQAVEILETADEVPGSEQELLDQAKGGDLTRLREIARDRRVGAIKPEELRQRQHRARSFRAWRDQLGMVCFNGALPPETGVPLLTRVERLADQLRRAARQGGADETWDAHAADAFAEIISGGPSGARGQTDLTVVCDIRAWRRGHAHEGEPCHILDGGPIPVDLAKELCDDAFLNVAFHDGFEIGKFSRLGRHIPVALRAALDLGDPPDFTGKTCADCGKRFRLELDHVDPVANGGVTSYKNLKHRCYTDHQAKTEKDRKAGLLKSKRGADPP